MVESFLEDGASGEGEIFFFTNQNCSIIAV